MDSTKRGDVFAGYMQFDHDGNLRVSEPFSCAPDKVAEELKAVDGRALLLEQATWAPAYLNRAFAESTESAPPSYGAKMPMVHQLYMIGMQSPDADLPDLGSKEVEVRRSPRLHTASQRRIPAQYLHEPHDCMALLRHTPNLISMHLKYCALHAPPEVNTSRAAHSRDPSVVPLHQLSTLDMWACIVSPEYLLGLLRSMPRLQHFRMSRCDVTRAHLQQLVLRCPSITSVVLRGCRQLQHEDLVPLSQLWHLKKLDLCQCSVDRMWVPILRFLRRHTKLREVLLHDSVATYTLQGYFRDWPEFHIHLLHDADDLSEEALYTPPGTAVTD